MRLRTRRAGAKAAVAGERSGGRPATALDAQTANHAAAFFTATDITGAQAETLTDGSSADCFAPLSDSKTQSRFQCYRVNKLYGHLCIITGHNHFYALGQLH